MPSRDDINVTNNIKELMKKINISVVEHIIIAGDTYFSFVESQML